MCLLISIFVFFLFYLFLISFIFPLPVNDSGITRYRTIPWTTLGLIIANTLIFVGWIAPELYTHVDGALAVRDSFEGYRAKIYMYGFSEESVVNNQGVGAFTTISSVFMHADFGHLFGNMVFLWTFGRRVEDACGSWRFLAFYLSAGILANLGSVLFNPAMDTLPGIGASGAIAGVMGAYLLLFPGAKVDALWGLGLLIRLPYAVVRTLWNRDAKIWRWTITLPAWMLLSWFVVQNFLPSLEVIQSDNEISGVNYLAHLAGFFAGLTVFLYVRKDLMLRYMRGRSL